MQCSIRHTRLTLITQRVGDSLLRDRPRMLWLPSFFKVWGKRGMHGTFHQFQQYLLRSLSADDAAHRKARFFTILEATKEVLEGSIQASQDILKDMGGYLFVLWSQFVLDLWKVILLLIVGDALDPQVSHHCRGYSGSCLWTALYRRALMELISVFAF